MKKALLTTLIVILLVIPAYSQVQVIEPPQKVWMDNMIDCAVGPFLVYFDRATEHEFRKLSYMYIERQMHHQTWSSLSDQELVSTSIRLIKETYNSFVVMKAVNEYQDVK